MTLPEYTPKDIERFWSHVDKTGECWLWTGGRSQHGGYGQFRVSKTLCVYAHRLAWELTNGPIPEGLWVLHNCPEGDRPACLNPAHLWLGTHDENMADMVAKGRHQTGERHWTQRHPELVPRGDDAFSRLHPERVARGEQCGTAKLNERQAREIRRRRSEGELLSTLAREYGVAATTICAIAKGRLWRHL